MSDFHFTPLPIWPRWLCWLIYRHKPNLHWADYNVDVSGIRCHYGKVNVND